MAKTKAKGKKASSAGAGKIVSLLISQIERDGGTQTRARMSEEVIEDYAEKLRDKIDLGKPVVYFSGTKYWLSDGFHRIAAHELIGATKVRCEVRDGSKRDAILYGVGANGRHGLRLTNPDKRAAVTKLLSDDEWQRWSDEVIAKKCVVSRRFVGIVRAELSPRNGSGVTKRKGADLNEYDMSQSVAANKARAGKKRSPEQTAVDLEPAQRSTKNEGDGNDNYMTKSEKDTAAESETDEADDVENTDDADDVEDTDNADDKADAIDDSAEVAQDAADADIEAELDEGSHAHDEAHGKLIDETLVDDERPSAVPVRGVDDTSMAAEPPHGPGRTRPARVGWGETVGEANGLPPVAGPAQPARKVCKHCRGAGWIEFDIANGVANAE